MKQGLFVLAVAMSMAAPCRSKEWSPVVLSADNISLVFDRSENGRGWDIIHIGGRVDRAEDVVALSDWRIKTAHHAQARPATCSALGDIGISQISSDGGLAVTHADGTLSTQLMCDAPEPVSDKHGAEHLVFRYRDAKYPFFVTQHFRALPRCDVVETWVEIRNGESGAIRLSRMDSFAVDFPTLADAYHVHRLAGQWAAEAQVVESELGRGEILSFGSRSGIRDAFEANAGLMVSIGSRASETDGTVFGGVLCWSGVWRMSVKRQITDALTVRAGVDNCFGAYVLDPGKTIILPKFAFTWSEHGKGRVSRNIHRWARDWQMPNGRKDRPILLNSWEGSYFSFTERTLTDMMDGVRDLGGEVFVLDDGWFGHGKYARDEVREDTAGLGDWTVNPKKLPNGLDGLAAEAKRRGLGFGLWVEPEMVNTNSWLYEQHPDWVLGERTRPLVVGRGGSQAVLDLVNPAVRHNIYSQLDKLHAKTPGLAYVKWDANADFMNLGSRYLDDSHQANFAFDYTVGLYDLLEKMRTKYPDVDIQACSSGGGRADYGFLHYADEFWGSDDSDARERVFIQWGESHFYPAQAIAAHVTAVPNHQTGRTTPLKFRFDVAMSARLGFELHPKDMSPDDVAFAKGCVANYKRIRSTVQHGDLYRLVSPCGHSYAALMYVNADRTHAVVFVFGLVRSKWRDFVPALRLQGLNPDKAYCISETNMRKGQKPHSPSVAVAVSGSSLETVGLPVWLEGDYDSAVFEMTQEGACLDKGF